ncbi:unnamed protein product [Oikopleura dioica]|uniref:CSD domain-containing protein n=1 Tax=Oikopleura dioica TaxID=34765 RepID=E4WWS8_OIKDI|nr:unnamed protein product [Oikopleura dioica]
MDKSIYETQKEIDEKFKSLVVADKNQLMIISKKNEQLTKMFEELSLAKKNMELLQKMIENHRSERRLIEERKKLVLDNPDLFNSEDPVKSSLEWWNGDDEPSKIIDLYTEKFTEFEKSSETINNLIILTQSTLLRILEIPNKVEAEKTASAGAKKAGKIKFFNHERDFGFIIEDGNQAEIYMNKINIVQIGKILSLRTGERVEFNVKRGHQGRLEAVQITACCSNNSETKAQMNSQSLTRRQKRLKRNENNKKMQKSKSKSTNDLSSLSAFRNQLNI